MDQIAPRRLPGHVKDDLRGAVKQGIGGINYIYEQAMTRIMAQSDDDKHYALSALSWMTRAKRPLSEAELLHAIAMRPENAPFDPDYLPETGMLQSICAGLIIVGDQRVRFVHYTTQEFFDVNQQKYFPNAEADITITCAAFLGVPSDTLPGLVEKWNPLHYYAMDYWMDHARAALGAHEEFRDRVIKALLEFLENTTRVQAASKECRETTALHLAAVYGLIPLIKPLMDRAADAMKDPKDSFGRTPLARVAKLGLKEAVKELVSFNQVDPDRTCNWGGSPLCHAVYSNNPEVVDIARNLLLTGRVKVDRLYEGQTPLYLAISNQNEDLIRLLLKHQANPNAVNIPGGNWMPGSDHWQTSPLLLAIKLRDVSIMKILLAAGADPNLPFGAVSPLISALNSKPCFLDGARLLIQHGVQATQKDSSRMKVDALLLNAIKQQDSDMLEVLLEWGANPTQNKLLRDCPLYLAWQRNWREGLEKMITKLTQWTAGSSKFKPSLAGVFQWITAGAARVSFQPNQEYMQFTALVVDILLRVRPDLKGALNESMPHAGDVRPLSIASLSGALPLAVVLLDHGATLDCPIPLINAACEGFEDMVELLLRRGAQVDAKAPNSSAAPLLYAASRRRLRICEILLENNATIESQNKDGRTALHLAAERGHTHVCRLLLNRGANKEARGNDGETPLLLAAQHNHWAVCSILLDRGADVETQCKCSNTRPLLVAVQRGHSEVCRLLLNHGADRTAVSSGGVTPLSAALGLSRWAIVKLLVTHHPKGGSRESECRAAFLTLTLSIQEWAINQELAIVTLLLKNLGAQIDAKTSSGQTALLWAVSRNNWRLGWFLLQNGASTETSNLQGETPLVLAAKNGSKSLCRLLLDRGANVNAKDLGGKRAFDWAPKVWDADLLNRLCQCLSPEPSESESAGFVAEAQGSSSSSGSVAVLGRGTLEVGGELEGKDHDADFCQSPSKRPRTREKEEDAGEFLTRGRAIGRCR